MLLEQLQDSLKSFVPIEKIKWHIDVDNIYAEYDKIFYRATLDKSNNSFITSMPASMFKNDVLFQQIKWLIVDDAIDRFGEPDRRDRAVERATLLLQALLNSIEETIKDTF